MLSGRRPVGAWERRVRWALGAMRDGMRLGVVQCFHENSVLPSTSSRRKYARERQDDDDSLAGEYPRHANIARGAAVRDNNAAAAENVQNVLVGRLAAV